VIVAELRRVVAAGDEQEARLAVRACGERLRAGTLPAETAHGELVEALALLTRHGSAIVRLAVADVCDAFPSDAFDDVHARLLADPDRYVRAAAEAAGHRRAEQRRRDARRGAATTKPSRRSSATSKHGTARPRGGSRSARWTSASSASRCGSSTR